jgi:hypothetical protein
LARKRVILYSAAAFIVLLAIVALVLQRQRVRRHRVFRPSAGEAKHAPMRGVPPVEQWTETFQQLQGEELADLLEAIEQKHPDLYAKWSLAYLHARALVDENETSAAARCITARRSPKMPRPAASATR